MDRFDLQYSEKNIPIPSKHDYKLQLISKTESLIKRMRWKALEFLGKLQSTGKETYGFRSRKCPPVVKELSKFEEDLLTMIGNIEFRVVNNDFQRKMKCDIQVIKECGKIIIPADKSSNSYEMEKEVYQKHLTDNITTAYKKTNQAKVKSIDVSNYKIAKKLGVDDRIEGLQNSEAYITVKDHKEDFPNNPKFRLINPSKTELGKISKRILDRINKEMLAAIQVNQWKNTKSVIEWFKSITSKNDCTFLKFDIDNFYPSITLDLFNKAIQHAKQYVDVSDDDLGIILQARKTLLFNDGEPWVKRTDDFDVPMGSYDGAEVCELVGTFMLVQLFQVIDKKDIGLYRDDGLGIMRRLGGPEMERRKKKIIQFFKEQGLKITIQVNLHKVDYLDVEFNLKNNSFKPYRKPDNTPLYININSNHPPSVLRHIPQGIGKRLSEVSSNEEVFKQAVPIYEEALKTSGFHEKLSFINSSEGSNNQQGNNRNRRRKIIWYNPPYSMNVKTNIGKEFLKLIRTHFHNQHVFHKIFNKNTLKISYSSTKNISSIIASHNKALIRKAEPAEAPCNCRNKNQCPLDGRCQVSNIVYESKVTSLPEGDEKFYLGICSTSFKDRLGTHHSSFNHRKYKTSTELSKYVWDLKDTNKGYNISWRLVKKVYGRPVRNFCKLCLTEKLFIIEYPNKDKLINSNCINKCRHESKYLLSNNSGRGRGNDTMD